MLDKQEFELTKEELEELIKELPEILKELEMLIVFDKNRYGKSVRSKEYDFF